MAAAASRKKKRTGAGIAGPVSRRRKLRLIFTSVMAGVIACALGAAFIVIPSAKYATAKKLMAEGDSFAAMEELSQIYSFRDAAALYSKGATQIGDSFLALGWNINAAVWFTKAGRSLEAEQIFDFNSVVMGASYVTAGIAQNGKTYYLSDRIGDDRRAGAQAIASYAGFLPHAPGVNGVDKFGFLKTHALGNYGLKLPGEQMEELSAEVNVKDMISAEGTGSAPDYAVLLYKNGSVKIVSEVEHPLTNTKSWRDIVSIREGYRKIFGIDSAGKLHIAYESSYPEELRYDISGWPAVQKVVETGKAVVGLTREGGIAVAYAGTDATYGHSILHQKDITDIATNSNILLLLRANGSVKAIRVPNWAADAASGADGYLDKAVAAVGRWRGVTRVRFAAKGIYGIRFNGAVYYVSCDVSYDSGTRKYAYDAHADFAAEVSRWTDVVDVISCGTHAVAVREDGTLKALGDGTYLEPRSTITGATDYIRKTGGSYMNVEDWKLW
ncbi:MAG: hypothetical protein IJK89_09020 [Clostridia bacterium]|nr:hypothetical protein [Clostridia bacterium]